MRQIFMGSTLQYMHDKVKDLDQLQAILNKYERKELTEKNLVYFIEKK